MIRSIQNLDYVFVDEKVIYDQKIIFKDKVDSPKIKVSYLILIVKYSSLVRTYDAIFTYYQDIFLNGKKSW